MNKLVIDTANEKLLITLLKGDEVFFLSSDTKSKHNEAMIPLLDTILKEHDLELKDIEELGVVIGPGSFTGIRVGIATIKAFRDVLGVKTKGINNLDYLFKVASSECKDVNVVAIKGSRDSYFVARLINNTLYKYERNLTLEELNAVAKDGKVGMFTEDNDVNAYVVEPDARILLECEIEAGEELIPVYYQLSQAENEKLKRGKIEIVSAKVGDIEDIYRIESASILSNSLNLVQIAEIINNDTYSSLVAKFNEVVVGFIILELTDEVNITSIAVDKNYRNLGIATKLVDSAKEFAKSKGIKSLSLEVSEKNITALLLYEKLGFETRRIRKSYYEDKSSAIEMIIRL